MTVSITAKSRTLSNGTANDASAPEANFVELYNNDAALKTKVDNLLSGNIEDSGTLTLNSNYTGSSPSNMTVAFERGTLANTAFRWNETKGYFEQTQDGTNYHPVAAVLSSDPASPAEGDVWYNNTTHLLKYRDNSWTVTVPTTSGLASVDARSSNTILAAADKAKLIDCTSTFTQTLTAAATLATGWFCYIRNSGTGIITIDPNSSETIDGQTTILVYPNEAFTIVCDGSNFKTIGRSKEWTVQTQSISNQTSVDFTQGLASAEIAEVYVRGDNIVNATDAVEMYIRVSEDAGSNWKSGASDYDYAAHYSTSGGIVNGNSAGDTKIVANVNTAGGHIGNAAGETPHSIRFVMSEPAGAFKKSFIGQMQIKESVAGNQGTCTFTGRYIGSTNAITGIRLLMSSGNISGEFSLIVRRK